jgi:hypothetical protein
METDAQEALPMDSFVASNDTSQLPELLMIVGIYVKQIN